MFSSEWLVEVEKDGSLSLQDVLRFNDRNKKYRFIATMVLAFQASILFFAAFKLFLMSVVTRLRFEKRL